MDNTDKKILYLLHKDSRMPLVRMARLVKLSKDAINNRIRKLQKARVIKEFTIEINHRALGFTIYTVFLRFRKVKSEEQDTIINLLRKTPNVTFVARCSGNYDMWVEFFVDSIARFDEILNDLINRIGDDLKEYKTLITISEFKTYSPLLESFFEKLLDKPVRKKLKAKPYRIDQIDYHILKKLEKNSRIPLIDISKDLELSIDVVRYRIRCMEDENIIRGYTIQLDYDKIGYTFYLLSLSFSNLTYDNEKRLKYFFDSNKNIRFAYRAAGQQEVTVEVLTREIDEFQLVLDSIRNRFYDILEDYAYLIVIEDYKSVTVPTMIF
jgi:Lrp/AsnC family transcriptional regulator, leucine-responsive regulatory protein